MSRREPYEIDMGMLTSFLKAIGCNKVCGLTATPYRIVQKYVTEGNQLYYTATLRVLTRMFGKY
jgi:hypothetical protein